MTLETLLARYGLLAICVGAGLEGETVVVAGGMLAHRGLVTLAGAMVAAICGSFIADQLFFALGRKFRNHPRVRRIAARPAFARAMSLFERHPTGFVFAFRFLYGLRTVSPIAIGMSSIKASRFALLNAAAAIVWGIAFTAIGFAFGQGIEHVFGRLRSVEHGLIVPAAIAIVVFAMIRLRTYRRKNK